MQDVNEQKEELRLKAFARRDSHADRQSAGRAICRRIMALPEWAHAETVLCYVDVRSEAPTRELLDDVLDRGNRLAVPYCHGDDLRLFLLKNMDELAAAPFGLLEPRIELRPREERKVEVQAADLIIVPGVAFDRRGGRLGHGRAYYDRLLADARPDAPLLAPAFECQLFPEVPMAPHDVYMDKVVTEEGIYEGIGR